MEAIAITNNENLKYSLLMFEENITGWTQMCIRLVPKD